MLRILQISITFIFVIICTTTAQTTQTAVPPPLAPRCEGDECYCIEGTHEAFFKGRKYCAPDSTEPCPEYAVRLSAQFCECRKGYHFLNDDRTVCVPDHIKEITTTPTKPTPMVPRCEGDICYCIEGTHEESFNGRKYCATDSTEPCNEYAVRLSPDVCECIAGYHFRDDERTVCIPDETIEPADKEPIIPTTTTTQRTNMTTTTTATTPTTTTTQSDRSGESEIPSNTVYIYVGIIVLVITALILIALLWLQLKR